MDSSPVDEEESLDSVYNFVGDASLNHPSVDHASDSSLSSYFNSSDSSSRMLFPRRSETRASQRSRSSKNNPLRSFRSEPAYKPLEGGKGSERVSLSPRRRHSHLFSDYPSDTRRRIDKSLSVLRDLRNATSPLDYSYHSRDDDLMGSSIFRERQENIERKMVQDLDERYREVIDSLNARITILEEEVLKANQDLSTSREFLRELESRDQGTQTTIDSGVQTATQTVSDPGVPVVTQTMVDPGIEVSTQTFKASAEAATQTALRPRLDAATNTDYIRLADTDSISNTSEDSNLPVLENLMDNLHVGTKEELFPAVKELQRKAQLLEQMKEFVDNIEYLTWDTPHVPLTTMCSRPDSIHAHLCDTHRAEWHKMQRRKQEIRRKDAYTAERLDATLNQITEWAHTMRHVIS